MELKKLWKNWACKGGEIMVKVLVTPRSFGKYSSKPYDLLRENGIEIISNPNGNILDKSELKDLIRDVDGIIVGVDKLDEEILKEARKIKAISKYGVGTDNIDMNYCKANGIDVSVATGANSSAVADYAFTLMLGVARRIVEIDKGCRSGDWSKKLV